MRFSRNLRKPKVKSQMTQIHGQMVRDFAVVMMMITMVIRSMMMIKIMIVMRAMVVGGYNL